MLAQLPQMEMGQFGMVIVGVFIVVVVLIGGVLGVALTVKQLFFSTSDRDAHATHNDIAVVKAELLAALTSTKEQLSLKIDGMAPLAKVVSVEARLDSMEKGHNELKEYTKDSVHSIKNALQSILLSLTEIKVGLKLPKQGGNSSSDATMTPDSGI